MLSLWREVKKDSKLKSVPSYIELAEARGLKIAMGLTSPRERVLLNCLSRCHNLMSPLAIVDISRSIQRAVLRTDGNVPTLGTGCVRLLVTSNGCFLSPRNCLWIQGLDPNTFDFSGISNDDVYRMAGNAMARPVLGAIVIACGAVLRFQ